METEELEDIIDSVVEDEMMEFVYDDGYDIIRTNPSDYTDDSWD